VVREIRELSPDVLCILEGPEGEDGIDRVSSDLLEGDWVAVRAEDNRYKIEGTQWIWFLVRAQMRVVRPEKIVDSSLPWSRIHREFIGGR
jgi:hypothetical protein